MTLTTAEPITDSGTGFAGLRCGHCGADAPVGPQFHLQPLLRAAARRLRLRASRRSVDPRGHRRPAEERLALCRAPAGRCCAARWAGGGLLAPDPGSAGWLVGSGSSACGSRTTRATRRSRSRIGWWPSRPRAPATSVSTRWRVHPPATWPHRWRPRRRRSDCGPSCSCRPTWSPRRSPRRQRSGRPWYASTDPYDAVNRLCLELTDELDGWAVVNVNLRPFYSEGSKTIAFEIAEQLGWRAPDAVVAPIASGSHVHEDRARLRGARRGRADRAARDALRRRPGGRMRSRRGGVTRPARPRSSRSARLERSSARWPSAAPPTVCRRWIWPERAAAASRESPTRTSSRRCATWPRPRAS